MQVLANGGVATACALGSRSRTTCAGRVAFAGAYAAATADTWATEIGTLAGQPPRSIVNCRPVATGMSGGIALPGTLAEIAGALWIGVVAPLGILLAHRSVGRILDAFGGDLPRSSGGLARLAIVSARRHRRRDRGLAARRDGAGAAAVRCLRAHLRDRSRTRAATDSAGARRARLFERRREPRSRPRSRRSPSPLPRSLRRRREPRSARCWRGRVQVPKPTSVGA